MKKPGIRPLRSLLTRNGLIAVAVFLVGAAISVAAMRFVDQLRETRLQNEFEHLAELHAASLEREIEVNLEAVRGLRRFLHAVPAVSQRQFDLYTNPLEDRMQSIQVLEWVPRVKHSQRAAFEAATRADGQPDFRVSERDAEGRLVAAAPRDEYFPIRYLSPLDANKAALGFDLASNSLRRAALEQARDSGKLVASAPVFLVQESTRSPSILIFAPLYDGLATNLSERRAVLRGMAVGVFHVDEIVLDALHKSQLDLADVSLRIRESAALQRDELLFAHLPQAWDKSPANLEFRHSLKVAGRHWIVSLRPSPAYLAAHRGAASWPVLLAGLVLSAMLAAYLAHLLNRQRIIRSQVREQTRELAASESRNRAVVDTAVNPIITMDQRGTVRSFNPAAERDFGYLAEEVIGRNVNMLMPEPYHSAHDGYLSRYLASGDPHIIGIGREVVARRKDGSQFPMDLAVGESRVEGEILFVGMIVDITLRKQAEQSLRESKEQAERANRMKSEFVNMMSHELRTPLTVILGYLPLLKNADKMPPAAMIVDMARDIQASGDHLLHLINDLLDLSKIEAGKLDLHPETFMLTDTVSEVLDRLRLKAQERGITLADETGTLQVRADPLRLSQILINLVGNAIKFTQGGSITIKARSLDGHAEISVADTGIGIPEADLPEIFDKFRQVDSSSTRKAGGTGLGLAITKSLVELHGGVISVDSHPGVGSTFTFTLSHSEE
ncbi:MAG: CHASE domain-containing protein [Pseudomonadota bacterium]|nr:CHASE domain-containing protein [Pseudomonadota bacterium]